MVCISKMSVMPSGNSLIRDISICWTIQWSRGLFIIDGRGILRQITMNDLPVGRSTDETLRLLQAFQYTDKHGEGNDCWWSVCASLIHAFSLSCWLASGCGYNHSQSRRKTEILQQNIRNEEELKRQLLLTLFHGIFVTQHVTNFCIVLSFSRILYFKKKVKK